MTEIRTRCEAVVAGHRLSMEYERYSDSEDDGSFSLYSPDDQELDRQAEWDDGVLSPHNPDNE